MSEPTIPDAMVNPINLRLRALQMSQTEENIGSSLKESITVGVILRREAGIAPDLFTDIARDLDEFRIPKMTLLVGLLAPYGILLSYPKAILAISQFLLGDTAEAEYARVDWDWFRKLYPNQGL